MYTVIVYLYSFVALLHTHIRYPPNRNDKIRDPGPVRPAILTSTSTTTRIILEMNQQQQDLNYLWIQHQRRNNKTTPSWACIHCPNMKIFLEADELWKHALLDHRDKVPSKKELRQSFRTRFEAESEQKRYIVTISQDNISTDNLYIDRRKTSPNFENLLSMKPRTCNMSHHLNMRKDL